MIRLGRRVDTISYESYQSRLKLLARLEIRTAIGPWPLRLNSAILKALRTAHPDIIWVDRGTLIWPSTLRCMRDGGCLLVHYNTDDLLNPRNFWRNFYRTIKLYDVQITTNIPNIDELPTLGARFVLRSLLGYDDELYFPRTLNQDDERKFGNNISFIGHWEPATELLFQYALEQGLVFNIRGYNWHKAKIARLKLIARGGPICLEEYVKTICASKINLGIVSIWNRSQTAGRTFEIPACGGFLLAPKTDEGVQVYNPDKEAVFYGDLAELVDKAKFYLNHEAKRRRIAEAGHRRCITSGYSWLDRMRNLIPPIEQRLKH